MSLSLNIFQMRFDGEFVKACVSDRTKLNDAFLSPILTCTTATIEVPLLSLSEILHSLEIILPSRIINWNNKGYGSSTHIDDKLLQVLLYFVTINKFY